MPELIGRFSWLAKLARIAMILLLIVLGLALAIGVAHLVQAALQRADPMTIFTRVLVILAELSAGVVVILAYGLILALLGVESSTRLAHDSISRLESLMEASQASLKRISDLAPLSDQAKALIYREREVDAVREIIHECLARQDYRQAEQLIERMANQFGFLAEAERFRAEVAANRENTSDQKVNAAIERVNETIAEKKWARAMRESERLLQVFPGNERVKALPKRVEDARDQHKRGLLKQYDDAVKRNDVDYSIQLLKELDMYLPPQEAAALEESARGVFRAKLHNLGVQFAIAVTDKQWRAAVKTGEEIVQEFPNSRMAAEVRQKLDALRQRAGTATGSPG